MAEYRPELPTEEWEPIARFTQKVVREVAPLVRYTEPDLLTAVSHHVHWCHLISGLPLKRKVLFRRDVIGAAVAMLAVHTEATMARRRSLLFRVGEALEVIPRPVPLPKLPGAPSSAPYSDREIDTLRLWAYWVQPSFQRPAQTLLALGLGAGLSTVELCGVTAADVLRDGLLVRVRAGSTPRLVPVLEEWVEDLVVAAEGSTAPEDTVFLPGVRFHKNIVLNFVDRAHGEARVSTQRMRTTWLVHHLRAGTPMQDLLAAAGLASMDALVRYERFLPPPSNPVGEVPSG